MGGPKARVGRVSVEGLWEGGKDRKVDAPFGRRDWLGVRPAAPLKGVAGRGRAGSVTGGGLRAEGIPASGANSFCTGRSDA